MEKDKLEQFFKRMAEDAAVQEKIKSLSGDMDALASYAGELGFDVSAEEMRTYTDQAVKVMGAKLQEKAASSQAAKSPGAQAFFALTKLADSDEGVARRLEELAEGSAEDLIAYGADLGFVFTKQDMLDIGKDILDQSDELSDEELELAAGGIGLLVLGFAAAAAAGVVLGLAAGGAVGAGGVGVVVGFVLGFTALAK